MKPEPLKETYEEYIGEIRVEPLKNKIVGSVFFYYEDVKGAVEWLKERIDEIRPDESDEFFSDILDAINEAFEDVIKEEKENETKTIKR